MSTVRSVHAFYEATGEHSVTRDRAEYVLGTAFDIVSRAIGGRIVMASLRGVNIPLDAAQPFSFAKIRLANAPHIALLTGRQLANPSSTIPISQRGGIGGVVQRGEGVGSELVVRQKHTDIVGGQAIEVGVHESGHTFGLGHCATQACVMHENGEIGAQVRAPILTKAQPFCDPCVERLQHNAGVFSTVDAAMAGDLLSQ